MFAKVYRTRRLSLNRATLLDDPGGHSKFYGIVRCGFSPRFYDVHANSGVELQVYPGPVF